MRRGYDEAVNWPSHWLKGALAQGGKNPTQRRGEGTTQHVQGHVLVGAAQLEVPRREGATDEEYEDRCEKLLNSILIPRSTCAAPSLETRRRSSTRCSKPAPGGCEDTAAREAVSHRQGRHHELGGQQQARGDVAGLREEGEEAGLICHIPTPFQGKLKAFGVDGRVIVLSCLLTLYTAVMNFEMYSRVGPPGLASK